MDITALISEDNISILQGSYTKKRILDAISKILTKSSSELDAHSILQQFIARERLGSTALGAGIALPHIRIAEVREPVACLVLLEEAIDFDSPDDLPVDIFFGLIVPEDSKETHLQILANLAKLFSDTSFCKSLRACKNTEEIQQALDIFLSKLNVDPTYA